MRDGQRVAARASQDGCPDGCGGIRARPPPRRETCGLLRRGADWEFVADLAALTAMDKEIRGVEAELFQQLGEVMA